MESTPRRCDHFPCALSPSLRRLIETRFADHLNGTGTDDSPRRAFLPLPAGERSEKLAKRFWESMTEEGLRALGTDEPEPEATPKQVDALQVKREQDRTLPGEKGTPSES